MKKYTLILSALFIAFSFTACSQGNVPAAVKTAFSKKFPNVKKVKWDKEGKTEWEAEFEIGEKDMSANFDLQGNWKETETDLENDEVPAVVLSTIKTQFPGYKVKEAAFTETPAYSAYEIDIKNGDKKMEVTIDKSGKVLSKESASEEKD